MDRRSPQLRWTAVRNGADTLAVALERPGTDVDPGNLRLVGGYQAPRSGATRSSPT